MTTILFAEDDPLTGRLYSTALGKAGFEVQLQTDGCSFMAKFLEAHPDAMLLDMMLPGLSGIEIIKRVRATWLGKSIPIVALTNAYVPQMIAQMQQAGANALFDKAVVTPHELCAVFKGLLLGSSSTAGQERNESIKCQVSESGWATVDRFVARRRK
ncbi:MAG TPA: response regulator [Verrucomicrobiae bacterium]|nr:response regulator [Verrucomicrobiae bacterium]